MKRLPSKPVYRVRTSVREDVGSGVAIGLFMATGFSGFVLVMAVLRGSTVYHDMGGMTTWQIVAFYYVMGLVGGTIHGLLRPLRSHYFGKLITAYVLLYLVYGGGTIAFWPMISADDDPANPVPLSSILGLWLILCLILAPIYVKIMDD